MPPRACASGVRTDEVVLEQGDMSTYPLVLEAPKGLEAQRAMAGVSLAAMAGVTAADHERISKFCRVTSWSWV